MLIPSLSSVWDWAPWLVGGGLLSWVAVALLAPSVLTVAAAWLTAMSPLVKGISDGLVTFVQTLWQGALDMLDNAASILFVATVVIVAMLYMRSAPDCEKCIKALRQDYTFVAKKPVAKQSVPYKTQHK